MPALCAAAALKTQVAEGTPVNIVVLPGKADKVDLGGSLALPRTVVPVVPSISGLSELLTAPAAAQAADSAMVATHPSPAAQAGVLSRPSAEVASGNGLIGQLKNIAVKLGFASACDNSSPRPLVLAQIDGLGHRALLQAMAQGHAPNLAALAKQQYRVAPYLNGLPTVTMSIQAATFYGRTLPGNEWYSKALGAAITATDWERGVPRQAGLLYGGRAYLSELSGGAEQGADVRRIFHEDISRMGTFRAVWKEFKAGFPLFARYLLSHNPFVTVPVFLYRMVHDVWTMKRDFKAMGADMPIDRKAMYFFALTSNLWSNIAMEGIKKAVRERAPIVYADFSTYDELAHYYGVLSRQALEMLRRIDRQIGEVAKFVAKQGGRLVIFSDHGQTPADNFIKTFGEAPQRMLDRMVREIRPGARDGELVFAHVYSMGNVYVAGSSGRLSLRQMRDRYPGLVEKLSGHPAVGVVAARDKRGIFLIGKDGWRILDAQGGRVDGAGSDPLAPYVDDRLDSRALAAQVRAYLKVQESGDLVVFASHVGGRTVDFNHSYTLASEHGGLGGEQMHPFIMFDPARTPVQPERVKDARGLYRIFKSLRG